MTPSASPNATAATVTHRKPGRLKRHAACHVKGGSAVAKDMPSTIASVGPGIAGVLVGFRRGVAWELQWQ
jgi:hypothetical protein